MTGSSLRDVAVIMARGNSRRMGRPKGLIFLPGNPEPFVVRIANLYRRAKMPVLVVVRTDLLEDYRKAVAGLKGVRVMGQASGGGTCQTMTSAWRFLDAESSLPLRLWAHPVDMPLVAPATITCLRETIPIKANRPWRPVLGERPGHPVVLPGEVMRLLEETSPVADGSLLDCLQHAVARGRVESVMTVTVTDEGVVQDFDTPEDLNVDFRKGRS